MVRRHTSGSTGIPLEVFYTPDEVAFHSLLTLRSEWEVGVRPWHHVAVVDQQLDRSRYRWIERMGLLRKSYVGLQATPREQIARLRQLRADVLIGWGNALLVLAREARGVGGLTFKYVFSTSTPLPDAARDEVEEAFQARVFRRYDAWETFLIGWECERRDGWHIESDHLILECLRDGEPTTGAGEVVVTNLDAFAMPIIRYGLGDIATRTEGACNCGRGFPRIRSLHGRSTEVIQLPDGRVLNVANQVVRQMEGVKQYRLVQETPIEYRLEVVPTAGFSSSELARVARQFNEQLGADLSLRVSLVDEVPTAPGSYLASEVDRNPVS